MGYRELPEGFLSLLTRATRSSPGVTMEATSMGAEKKTFSFTSVLRVSMCPPYPNLTTCDHSVSVSNDFLNFLYAGVKA